MDDPVRDITSVVHRLTQGSPKVQEAAINEYFTPDASFTHPFCRTGSFDGSRRLIHAIFRWYKVLSPRIELRVQSVAFDEANLLLYVTISQVFAIWFIPFHRSPVTLTTVLQLVRGGGSTPGKYYIAAQNDLYQVDQFVRFFAPWGIGTTLVLLWHFAATFCCAVLAYLTTPFTAGMQMYDDRQTGNHRVDGAGSAREHVGPGAYSSAKGLAGVNGMTNGSQQQYGNMRVVKAD